MMMQNGQVDEETLEQARTFFNQVDAVNLEEVTTHVLCVAIRELVNQVELDDGIERRVRRARVRRAQIDTFVPMRIFNKMLATRDRVVREREAYLQKGGEEDPMMIWMTNQVLNVWKLSEPDMTYEALVDGLSFDKISKLFAAFFGDVVKQATQRQL